MDKFITDLKDKFQNGNICLRFIYINVGVFLVTTLLSVFMQLFNLSSFVWLRYLELPAWGERLIYQPWSLFTYMFMHAGLLHILFNMMWLYWFGQMFLYSFSSKHFRGLYLLGGLLGGILYLISYNVFPYFQGYIYTSFLVGASASVLAIVVATAMNNPEQRINFFIIGSVRLKHVALIMVVSDLLFITSENAGGHIAHLGGALAGFWFAWGMQNGRCDATLWINKTIDFIGALFTRSPRKQKPKMKVHYSEREKDYEYNARKKTQSDEIDRILDKLKKSGYESLTTQEKKSLFDASKK